MSNIKKELANTKLDTFEYLVERGKIKEYANAICDPNPIYREVELARSHGFDNVPMPVTFPVNNLLQANSENTVLDAMMDLGMDATKGVHGSCEFVYERPVCAGETFRGEVWYGNIYEKEGKRGGTMTFVEMDVKFFDRDDKMAFMMRNVLIERG
ncbi:MAG: MaoC family dehydratase [Proteobacteria bacterium]|nr:MaoC family dehydratase [Pseudomonadota bacterium]